MCVNAFAFKSYLQVTKITHTRMGVPSTMRMTGSRAKNPVKEGVAGTTSLGVSLSCGAEEAAGGWGVG